VLDKPPAAPLSFPATMFTGIVETTGAVRRISRGKRAMRLEISAPKIARGLKKGDSVAVNGVCLTAVSVKKSGEIAFDVLNETLRLTNLQFIRRGALVNLERPLRFSDRFGGHFVLGHVDGLGKIEVFEQRGADFYLKIAAPRAICGLVVYKGSIAVDGISLTVAETGKKSFAVWIIPHTRDVTNLRERRAGDRVNLEADVLGKYVKKFLHQR
jgi:riboflavin synthase